jgi:hypothetical protein
LFQKIHFINAGREKPAPATFLIPPLRKVECKKVGISFQPWGAMPRAENCSKVQRTLDIENFNRFKEHWT